MRNTYCSYGPEGTGKEQRLVCVLWLLFLVNVTGSAVSEEVSYLTPVRDSL